MENDYKNTLNEKLINDPHFTNQVREHINALFFNSGEEIINNNDVIAKSYIDVVNEISYLIVYRNNFFEVYTQKEEKNLGNPFNFYTDKLQADSNADIYSDKVMVIAKDEETSQHSKQSYSEDFNNLYSKESGKFDERALQKMQQMFRSILGGEEDFYNASPYKNKVFLTFLEQENIYKNKLALDNFDYSQLENNHQFFSLVEKRKEDIAMSIEFIHNIVKNKGFTKKECFSFNDSDNKIYKRQQYTVLENQKYQFVIDYQDKDNYLILATGHRSYPRNKKHDKIQSLLLDVKQNQLNYIDHVALHVKDGKVVFADNSIMNAIDFEIDLAKQNLKDAGLGQIVYPVDMKSYDYQLAFSNYKYHKSETDFLIHALFVPANGYCYDAKQGRFYTEVQYVPDLIENYKAKDQEKDKPMSYLSSFSPLPKIKKLDPQWLSGLEYLLEKIEKDKPRYSVQLLMHNKTFEEVKEYLKEVVEYNKELTRKNQKKNR